MLSTRWDEQGGTYAAPDATFANTVTFERGHALSELISAVLEAGLVLELFHEQSYTNVPWPWAAEGSRRLLPPSGGMAEVPAHVFPARS